MFDPIESDVIYGPLDESEDAVAAANDLADKNDDPDMQVIENGCLVSIKRMFRCRKMLIYNY
jgi:hypothetical protein